MPVMDGLEATRQIMAAATSAPTKVVILTTFDLDEYVYEALRAGASGFLLKDTLPDDLLDAVRVVAAGEALLSPKITRRLIEEFAQRPEPGDGGVADARLQAHRPRDGRCSAWWPRASVQRRDRRGAVREPRHGEDPREPPALPSSGPGPEW